MAGMLRSVKKKNIVGGGGGGGECVRLLSYKLP